MAAGKTVGRFIELAGECVAGVVLDGLNEVPWERLESALAPHSAEEMLRALRHLAAKGEAATEDDCYPLFDSFALSTGRIAPAATAALPFVVALAHDPAMGARLTLVELLTGLAKAAAKAEPDKVDAEWPEAWRRHRPQLRALLTDPRPEIRRQALPLAEGVGELLERWRAETDPTVRLPVLLELGTAARTADTDAVERVRAVLAEVLRTDGPVMRVAAVHAWAWFEPRAAVRELDLLVEVLSDPAVRPLFEAIWYVPDFKWAFTREDVVSRAVGLFEDVPHTALDFVVRLIDAARRNGDAPLCSAALDEAWRLLVDRPSAAPVLLPLAGALLADPDAGVRYRAAHLLAVLGRQAAPYADGLAALLDDPGEAGDLIEGTVGEQARWALTRIGDERALPGLVEQLYAPYEGQWSRSYCSGDPRLPEVEDVLTPLSAHAETLLPAVRELLRKDGKGGSLTCSFLEVLQAWGPAAAPALPEVVALLDDARYSVSAMEALMAMGPAARSAEPAVRRATVLDHPGNHEYVAWAAWRLGGDRDTALAPIAEAVLTEEGPLLYGPVERLGDFGPVAAPYADRVRYIMERCDGYQRLKAAIALWSITAEAEPTVSVLTEYVLPMADGDDSYGFLSFALSAFTRIGTVSPAARAALRTLRDSDRRLSAHQDYRAVLGDEEMRSAIDEVLALP
ncbi:hypothetical protein [Streptomyces capitiformicae]|uniref:HEAT repeat protein n=1 Tax=Streptomyces capitiformicae TaxID=2014920 RepID=A0A919GGN9_9ACTN|nr:hypothetical protein [Streptomyces capitiformicae]GHH84413.1 hypothetical protein GCM10017771_13640 [Streptomyces capitiformicae]